MSVFVVRLGCGLNPALATIAFLKDSLRTCLSRLSTSAVVLDKEAHPGIGYLKDGMETVLRPEEEYPDWLWQLHKPKLTLEELIPQSPSYRRLLRKKQRREENERRKMKRF